MQLGKGITISHQIHLGKPIKYSEFSNDFRKLHQKFIIGLYDAKEKEI